MVLFKIYSFSKVPRLFCGPYSEMMVNCFACGKDIGVSTERRSFSGERPSESKVRVLHAWRSMVQEELSTIRIASLCVSITGTRGLQVMLFIGM